MDFSKQVAAARDIAQRLSEARDTQTAARQAVEALEAEYAEAKRAVLDALETEIARPEGAGESVDSAVEREAAPAAVSKH